jgi:type III secretion system YscQ/HrcQ family protein
MIDDLSLFLGEEVYFKLFENDNIPSDLGQSLKFRISLNGLDSKFTTALTIWPGSDKAWQILHEKLLGLSDLKNLDLRALTVPMRITIGGQKISINDLNCLLPGDLLLSVPDIDPNVLYLEYPEQAWASMIVKDGQSTLTQALLKEMDVVDNNMPDEVTSAGNSMVNLLACPGIKAIELPIRFEVGQKTMTLGQIEGLNVGSVIDFATNGLQVNVTCHGQTLAYGQLIDMEGIVGVQITKLNSLALTPNSSRE